MYPDAYESRVSVAVRLRPPSNGSANYKEVFSVDGNELTIHDPLPRGRSESTYTFSNVFKPEHGQDVVFNVVARPLVDRLLSGYNSCCFAYGQTGSGKTHSVFGEGNAEKRGMLARSIEYLFEKIEVLADRKEIGMAVSFIEIYLDQVKDLGKFYAERRDAVKNAKDTAKDVGKDTAKAQTESQETEEVPYASQDLAIHESPQGLVYVEDLSIVPVGNIREVLDVINLGVQMRATFETKLNHRSSRSHTIFTVNLVQKSRTSSNAAMVASTVNFVDLAGSERIARSQSEGRRFQEAVMINSSLSALGKVVLALAVDAKHVPYRDSKLTRILQNSLSGNSYTSMLATVDPTVENFEESLNSLAFADRCKSVSILPVKNVVDQSQGSYDKRVQQLMTEIAALTHQLENATKLQKLKEATAAAAMQRLDEAQASRPPSKQPPSKPDNAAAQTNRTVRETQSLPAAPVASPPQGGDEPIASRLVEAITSASADSSTAEEQAAAAQVIQLAAQERLAAEQKQTVQLQQKAAAATRKLEEAKIEMATQGEQRRREVAAVRESNKDLEEEIRKCRQAMSHLTGDLAEQRASRLKSVEKNIEQVIGSKKALLSAMPKEVLGGMAEEDVDPAIAALDAVDRRWSKESSVLEGKHGQAVAALENGHATECGTIDLQHRQWLSEIDARCTRVQSELEEYRTRVQWWQQQLRGDLVAAYDVVQKLARLVDNLETGVPSQFRSDIRPVRPGSARSRLGSAQSRPGSARNGPGVSQSCSSLRSGTSREPASAFEQLKREMAELRRQVDRHQRMPQLPREAAGGKEFTPSSGAGSCPNTHGGVLGGRIVGWDAGEFARGFCDTLEEDDVCTTPDASLQRLDAPKLRALCLALRDRCHMAPAERNAERQRCREAVARDLATHGRVDRIRELEQEIDGYRTKLRVEENRIAQLENALQSCARVESSRPTSASTRPSSASRSRPVSATAGAMLVRPSSVGPARS